jgi:peroxiredoxin
MHRLFTRLTVLLFILCLGISMHPADNMVVNDFALPAANGQTVATSQYKNAKGFIVVFTCLHCPFAKLYHQRLIALQKTFGPQNVPLLLINSSDTIMFANENLRNMAQLAKDKQYNFPFLFDPSQQVAKNFKAEKTPHAFVIWKVRNQWVIKYQGAIDDNGAQPALVKASYVANAVNQLLKGQPVATAEGFSIGCAIHYRR